MAVGHGENSAVALAFNGREKALHFLLGEDSDGAFFYCSLFCLE